MDEVAIRGHRLSRRTALRATAGAALGLAATALPPGPARAAPRRTPTAAGARNAEDFFQELDVKIEAAMVKHRVPGVAVGIYYQGQEYVRGYGVTNVDEPQPVTGDTLFRIASTTKTFTGTAVMRLVEQGRLDLDATVRTYLPDFRVADGAAAARVTLRQCLDHSAGWLGDDFEDFGGGDDALARYVAGMATLPQLTPPGAQFAYSNSAIAVAGRVIEAVTGTSYERAVRELLIDPLGLSRTRFFTDRVAGYPIAGSHAVTDGRAVFSPDPWFVARSAHPFAGLISNARDQLRYARFHLGDGRALDGTPLLTPASLAAMRSDAGPGGTFFSELDGFGVGLGLRRTAEGVRVIEHGGDWQGQHSGFLLVPERDFAITMLTNSTGGAPMKVELFYDDWALRRCAGLQNPPGRTARVSATRLAEYAGTYVRESVDEAGQPKDVVLVLTADEGALRVEIDGAADVAGFGLAFYRGEYVVVAGDLFEPLGSCRANFVRGVDGRVAWLSFGGRLYRHME